MIEEAFSLLVSNLNLNRKQKKKIKHRFYHSFFKIVEDSMETNPEKVIEKIMIEFNEYVLSIDESRDRHIENLKKDN
jgi:hypothetical protein